MIVFGLAMIAFALVYLAVLAGSAVVAVVVLSASLVALFFRGFRAAGVATLIVAATAGAAGAAVYAAVVTGFEHEITSTGLTLSAMVAFAWGGLAVALLSGGMTALLAGWRGRVGERVRAYFRRGAVSLGVWPPASSGPVSG
ncbi:MAG: hypothetical protein JOZ54_18435 [Acidobacteria bacterium]|nr:hypothetical protein [Acidobacteriota bacterium]